MVNSGIHGGCRSEAIFVSKNVGAGAALRESSPNVRVVATLMFPRSKPKRRDQSPGGEGERDDGN